MFYLHYLLISKGMQSQISFLNLISVENVSLHDSPCRAIDVCTDERLTVVVPPRSDDYRSSRVANLRGSVAKTTENHGA